MDFRNERTFKVTVRLATSLRKPKQQLLFLDLKCGYIFLAIVKRYFEETFFLYHLSELR